MLFILSSDRPNTSAYASEEIQPGEAVAIDANGDAKLCTGDDDFTGLAAGMYSGEYVADTDEDWRNSYDNFAYDSTDDHPMPIGGDEDGAGLRMRTAKDNGTDPAPSIDGWTVVGVPAAGDLTTPNDTHFGRLVEEGYTSGAGTSPVTYSRANSNFLAIGYAKPTGPAVNTGDTAGFDELVHIEVDKSL